MSHQYYLPIVEVFMQYFQYWKTVGMIQSNQHIVEYQQFKIIRGGCGCTSEPSGKINLQGQR